MRTTKEEEEEDEEEEEALDEHAVGREREGDASHLHARTTGVREAYAPSTTHEQSVHFYWTFPFVRTIMAAL